MRDPASEQNATPITPLGSLLVKVHSRCNLMCDYCYEYNCGNTSWRKKPKEMNEAVYEQMLSPFANQKRQKANFFAGVKKRLSGISRGSKI